MRFWPLSLWVFREVTMFAVGSDRSILTIHSICFNDYSEKENEILWLTDIRSV